MIIQHQSSLINVITVEGILHMQYRVKYTGSWVHIKIHKNIPILHVLPEAFLTFASKMFLGPSYKMHPIHTAYTPCIEQIREGPIKIF